MRVPIPLCLLAPVLGVALALAPACKKDDGTTGNPRPPTGPSAGPAQRAGAKIDEGVAATKQAVKSGARAVGSAVEKTGEKIKPRE